MFFRKLVSLVIWQLGEVGQEDKIESLIQDTVLDMSKRPDNEKPHFVLCSIGNKYSKACIVDNISPGNLAFSIKNGLSVPTGVNLITMAGS